MRDRSFALTLLICIISLLLVSDTVFAGDDDDDENQVDRSKLVALAKLFVPADMAAQSKRDPHTMPLSVDATIGNLDGAGSALYLIAVYGNGVNGRVRAFKVDASGPRLVAEPNVPGMGGVTPHVDLEDLDGDGKPEVIVSFAGWATVQACGY